MFLKKRKNPVGPTDNSTGAFACNIEVFNEARVDPALYSPTALAFLGDAVFSLLVREGLLKSGNRPAQKLHKMSMLFVSAAAQAKAASVLLPMLSEEEAAVYKRGRNAHSSHTPKNQTEADYHSATGLEALFGYLYLKNEKERIAELFGIIMGGYYE
ncbi:MAG: Mini-ribonuclease 3 [Firmicutes bacterium ADurb.Bin300]|jgi:ribonuclease-3 family protein|nr:MAG: Mini-ribonuclease 3 [Firmicutes bacterium ADurb.Bin300]